MVRTSPMALVPRFDVHLLTIAWHAGGDLWDCIDQIADASDISEALRIIRDVLRALAHCHSLGVTHRDVKPENVLLTTIEGKRVWKLCDFGAAAFSRRGAYHRCKLPQPGCLCSLSCIECSGAAVRRGRNAGVQCARGALRIQAW